MPSLNESQPWRLEPICVFGGFRLMWVRDQHLGDEGWDVKYGAAVGGVFPTAAEAIAANRGRSTDDPD